MAITLADFNKIWASSSPLTPYSFSDDNYNEGWNFIGVTPPSRQMWDFLQKNNDEKMKYLANNYLPLSGGTMTGNITSSVADAKYLKANDSGANNFFGGTNWNKGGFVSIYGKDSTNALAGGFRIGSHDGSNGKFLDGKPDGTLTWAGSNILTAANYNSYSLPLSGGTMTGAITLSNGKGVLRSYSSGTFLYAEESTPNTRLELHTNANGEGFRLIAGNGTQGVAFIGNPNGTLTWGGNNVITSAGGTLTGNVNINKSEFWLSNIHANDDGVIRFRTNDTSWKNGASFSLTAMNHSDGGKFLLQAGDGTNTPTLVGSPDGTLTWNGKSIPQRAYGIQLEGSGDGSTYTFNINKNGAIIFAKRGANSSCHMVDMWSAGSVAMFSSGTDPITITKSSDSNEVTITNTNDSAIAIKIINGDEL